MEPVTVHRSFSPADAHLVCARLEAAGFTASVVHELASLSLEGYAMAAGGIQVQVPPDQVQDAREFLDTPVPSISPET